MDEITAELLREVLEQYRTPDPKIVGKLPKGGVTLSFVGHGAITELLIQIDPLWSWEPLEIRDGRPMIHVENGMATMWGRMTIHGKSMLGVGSVRADKPEYEKELVGDFLRNASMRFGVCLALWQKGEAERGGDWSDAPVRKAKVPRQAPTSDVGEDEEYLRDAFVDMSEVPVPAKVTPTASTQKYPPSEKQMALIRKMITDKGVSDPMTMASELLGRKVSGLSDLSGKDASAFIGELIAMKPNQSPQREIFADPADEPF